MQWGFYICTIWNTKIMEIHDQVCKDILTWNTLLNDSNYFETDSFPDVWRKKSQSFTQKRKKKHFWFEVPL